MATTAFDTIREAIETRLQTNLAGEEIEFANVPLDSPTDVWYRLNINYGLSDIAAMGNNKRIRHNGLILVSIFTPKNEGTINAMQRADAVATIFRLQDFSGVVSLTPSVTVVGVNGEWHQVNVLTPFYFDEINTN